MMMKKKRILFIEKEGEEEYDDDEEENIVYKIPSIQFHNVKTVAFKPKYLIWKAETPSFLFDAFDQILSSPSSLSS
jgi:hypothetical protein